VTPPIVYNPMATATLNAGPIIQTQQLEILSRPLDGFVAGRNYRLNDVMGSLPVGPLRSTALLAGSSDTMITMRLVTAGDGTVTPQYLFRQAGDIPFEGPIVRVGHGGGPPAEPIPGGSLALTLGGSAILIGTNVFLAKNNVPAPVIGPFMGGTYALAEVGSHFLTAPSARVPAGPLNQFLNQGLTSMGVGTTVQYGWAYGLDALGAPMGSDANTYGSIGGTILTFAPAINSPLNPVYSPTFANAFRSAIGVGLGGAGTGGSYVFLARGGMAGGAGWAGGTMQGVGALGAVLMGSQLGGWITEAATGMNDENDPYGQLAKLARDRMYSDAWGCLGRSPFGHLMAGITVLALGSDDFAEAMGYAEQSIVRDTRDFTDNMDSNLVAFLMRSATDLDQVPMAAGDLEEGIRTFYSDNRSAMASSYRVIDILRRTHKLSRDEGGMTRFVEADGHIRDRAAFNTFAADVAHRELGIRTRRLAALWERHGIVLSATGQVAPASGTSFTPEQIDFLEGDGARLGSEIMRLTNALATLRPAPVVLN